MLKVAVYQMRSNLKMEEWSRWDHVCFSIIHSPGHLTHRYQTHYRLFFCALSTPHPDRAKIVANGIFAMQPTSAEVRGALSLVGDS